MDNLFYKLGKYNHKISIALLHKQQNKYSNYFQHKNKYLKVLLSNARRLKQIGGVGSINKEAFDKARAAIKTKNEATTTENATKIDDLTAQIVELNTKNDTLTRARDALVEELATLTTTSTGKQTEITTLNAQIVAFTAQIVANETQISTLNTQLNLVIKDYNKIYLNLLDMIIQHKMLLETVKTSPEDINALITSLGLTQPEKDYVDSNGVNPFVPKKIADWPITE